MYWRNVGHKWVNKDPSKSYGMLVRTLIHRICADLMVHIILSFSSGPMYDTCSCI